MNFGKEMCNVWPLSKHAQHLQKFVMFYLANLVIWQLQNYLPSKKNNFSSIICYFGLGEMKKKAIDSMQVGRRLYFRGQYAACKQGEDLPSSLPSCQIYAVREGFCQVAIFC